MSIPNKSNFKFQELTPITGVKPYVIRFWETEFSEIEPITSDSGQKIYSRKDVETILRVKKLLFEDKLSIPEAKLRMQTQEVIEMADQTPVEVPVAKNDLSELKNMLLTSLDLIRDIKFRRKW